MDPIFGEYPIHQDCALINFGAMSANVKSFRDSDLQNQVDDDQENGENDETQVLPVDEEEGDITGNYALETERIFVLPVQTEVAQFGKDVKGRQTN